MKKIFYYICAAALTFVVVSCDKEVTTMPEDASQMTIVATLGSDDATKTILSGNNDSGYRTFWKEGDKITAYEPRTKMHHPYTLTSGAGTSIGTFTGDKLPEGDYIAYYGTGFSCGYELYPKFGNLSNQQAYIDSDDASYFAITAEVSVDAQGHASATNFRNATGLLQLNLTGVGTLKTIKVSTEKYIAGYFLIDEEGAIRIIIDYPTQIQKYIEFDCGENGITFHAEDKKTVYISIPKSTYHDLKIEFIGIDGYTATKTLKDDKVLNITRAQITPVDLKFLLFDSTGEDGGKPWVQLWEGGPKWATFNVDASSEDEPGTYFDGWSGDAGVYWPNWHTPNQEDFGDLAYFCDLTWDNERKLMIFRGRGPFSDNYIAMKAGGKFRPDGVQEGLGTDGYYWTSDWEDIQHQYRNIMKFWDLQVCCDHDVEEPSNRLLIRPVLNEQEE